jgi:DNA-binding transcriptional regulator of glucitol operon
MKKSKNKAWKHFILVTFLFLFVALDLLVLDSMLKFNRAFLYGIFSGMFTVWVVFTVFHIREIRKPGYRMDERMKFIIRTSGFYAFIVFYLIAAFFAIIVRGTNIEIPLTVKELSTWALNLLFLIYITIFLILSKRY